MKKRRIRRIKNKKIISALSIAIIVMAFGTVGLKFMRDEAKSHDDRKGNVELAGNEDDIETNYSENSHFAVKPESSGIPEASENNVLSGLQESSGINESSLSEVQGNAESSTSVFPDYCGEPCIAIDHSGACFTAEEITADSFEFYGELDSLGRCTGAIACVGVDLMPTEDRSLLVSVKPAGWQSTQYDFIDQKYLYNRCHLLAYQLTAENANERNLITGTRYLNITGMLPFENQIRNYIRNTGNHVMYRVTPVFSESNLIADGVRMEAYSVEDAGSGIQFCVYCYNVQPGVVINYVDGSSVSDGTVTAEMLENAGSTWYDETAAKEAAAQYYDENGTEYVLNTRRMKIHRPECDSVVEMSPKNSYEIKAFLQVLVDAGYDPCKNCKPE